MKTDGDERARVALWKAALREGPGETPGPAGRALLADLRKLWLTREAEQTRAMRESPFPLPVDLAVRPLDALWAWWPEGRGGDDGPNEIALGHWRGLHDAALRARERLKRERVDPVSCEDFRSLYPAGIQMAATLLPALFHATAQGDAHAFALAFETLVAADAWVGDDDEMSIAWCGSGGLIRPPDPEDPRDDGFAGIRRRALSTLFHLGLRAGIAEAAWNAMRMLWTNPGDAEASGFRFRRNRGGFLHPPWAGLAFRAADGGCPDAMPAADSFREARAEDGDRFLSEAERCRRKIRRLSRAWRRIGPLAGGEPSFFSVAEEWARTGDEEGKLWFLHERQARERTAGKWIRAFSPEEAERAGRPFRAELARVAQETGDPVARYFALHVGHNRLPLPAGPARDEFKRLCREGAPLALASLARAVLGGEWRGDACGPWRPAPVWSEDETENERPSAFAKTTFRELAESGDAFGCFYLGQIAWKRAFDRLDAIRARRSGGTETRLRFLDRDRLFLEVPCEEADRWFRRGSALGGRGARECGRTLAWRAAGRAGYASNGKR